MLDESDKKSSKLLDETLKEVDKVNIKLDKLEGRRLIAFSCVFVFGIITLMLIVGLCTPDGRVSIGFMFFIPPVVLILFGSPPALVISSVVLILSVIKKAKVDILAAELAACVSDYHKNMPPYDGDDPDELLARSVERITGQPSRMWAKNFSWYS